MAKRPGHVEVVTEVGYCNFCNRTRNLRREEHHLGGLVRTIVTCETCHRTLTSTMGVAAAEPEAQPEPVTEPERKTPEPKTEAPKPARGRAKAAATKEKAATKRAAATQPKAAAKPKTTAQR